jgi:multiple sugar transport system ATP-binding protein
VATVHIDQLTKRFGNETVVDHVDLRIDDGELLVIVGPSGCGKTSVLRMVAGLESITSGEILIDGRPAADVHRGRRTTAMMFQDAALYPHMNVRENIAFPLEMAHIHKRRVEREVEATAELLGLTPWLDARPSELSGGQRQRVAMARALIRRPELMLMDEPMSNLDAKLRGELRAVIARLQRRLGITTLYVTHDQVEAMSLGDRIAVMRRGQIVQVGPPSDIYRRPSDLFVATFVGTPAMNLFIATVAADCDGIVLVAGSSHWPVGPRWSLSLEDRVGGQLVVGIRPQAFRFTGDGAIVDVDRIDRIGGRVEIGATLDVPGAVMDGDRLVVGTRPTALTIDIDADNDDDLDLELWRPSHLVVDPDDIHLFDPATGRSLRPVQRFAVTQG